MLKNLSVQEIELELFEQVKFVKDYNGLGKAFPNMVIGEHAVNTSRLFYFRIEFMSLSLFLECIENVICMCDKPADAGYSVRSLVEVFEYLKEGCRHYYGY